MTRVAVVCGTVLLAILVVRNGFMFTQKLYEQGDAGANSLLIAQARHFRLLTGNYSREGFHHPGPGYLYAQAAAEWLLHDLLHVVPTAWNAHMLAVFALNCLFAALAVAIGYGWTRSVAGAAVTFAVIVLFAIQYPWIMNSDWMPNMYVMPYVVFVIAAASVMAGAVRDSWIMALSGWLLIHGHACFLFFVPLITVAVAGYLAWRRRLGLFRDRGIWLPVAVISFVFALPVGANLVLHWPGDFGHYLSYGRSGRAGGHDAAAVVKYALWYWWPHPSSLAIAVITPVMLTGAAAAATRWLAPHALRPFLWALLGINLLSTLGVLFYVAEGIDSLSETYIGYFYWSAPLVTTVVAGLAVIEAARQHLGRAAGAAAVAIAVAATAYFAALPGARAITNDIDPALPHAVSALAERSGGKTVVLHIADHMTWVETTGLLLQAERSRVRICVDNPWFAFLFTRHFICAPDEAAAGAGYWLYKRSPPAGEPVVLRFSGILVTASKGTSWSTR